MEVEEILEKFYEGAYTFIEKEYKALTKEQLKTIILTIFDTMCIAEYEDTKFETYLILKSIWNDKKRG